MAFELPTLSAAELDVLLDERFGQLANDMLNATGYFAPADNPEIMSGTTFDGGTVLLSVDMPIQSSAVQEDLLASLSRVFTKYGRVSLSQDFRTSTAQLGRSNDGLVNGMLYLPRLVERQSFGHLRTVAASRGWLMNFEEDHDMVKGYHTKTNAFWTVSIHLTFVRDSLNFGQEFVVGGGVDSSARLFPSLKQATVKAAG